MTASPLSTHAGRAAPLLVTTPDGPRVAVHEWGNPQGPEILLIHGVAQSHLCFERQFANELAHEHRLVAYDVRGHGGSDKPLSAEFYCDGKRWADEVEAVIEAKGLRKPVLVGWSLGGRIIAQYLLHHGDRRLSGVNLVASRVIPDKRFSGPASLALPTVEPRDLSGHIAMAKTFLRACYYRPPADEDFATQLAYNMLAPIEVRAAIREWPADLARTTAALGAVRVPVLVTHGRRDAIVLPAVAELAAATIPGAALSWYEGCGHSPHWEDAQRFNRELAAFVAAARTRAS
jgi:pimeloyl-ACP methyl ester carboxylesterase